MTKGRTPVDPSEASEITVLGAGVSGLSVAIALAQRGFPVTVFERADEISEVGAGLQISPNGARVLHALGLADVFEAATLRSQAVILRDGFDGREVLRMGLPHQSLPEPGFHLTHRADLIALLAAAARDAGVNIRLSQHVSSVVIDRDGTPILRMINGAQMRCDMLVGADGLHSPTRRAVQSFTPAQPFFTGQVAWRMIVPCDPETPPEANVYMGAGRHLVSYPMRDRSLRNVVAVEERDGWAEEGWNITDEPTRVQRAFSGFAPEVRTWLSDAREVYLWGLFRHEIAEKWHKGRAVILGDAAHPTLPFLAQGANMALEDAWVLAEAIAGPLPFEQSLAAYQAARLPRVRKIVAAANSNAKAYHMRPGPIRSIAHTALGLANRYKPDMMLKRFDWLYDFDVTKISH